MSQEVECKIMDMTVKEFIDLAALKNIKVVNNGMSALKKNVNRVFYEWMTSLL